MADDGILNFIRPVQQDVELNDAGQPVLDPAGNPTVTITSADDSAKVGSQFIHLKENGGISYNDDNLGLYIDPNALPTIDGLLTEAEANARFIHETDRGDFATATQGATADSALQPDGDGSMLTGISTEDKKWDGTLINLGSTTYLLSTFIPETDRDTFASAAQGDTADSALQPDGDGSMLTGVSKMDNKWDGTLVNLGSTTYLLSTFIQESQRGDFATSTQGDTADSALQPDGDGSMLTGITAVSVIDDGSITIPKLKISNSPSDGDVLGYKDDSSKMTWTAGVTGITPEQATAITTNTAKTGITAAQTAAIILNTAKTGITTAQAGAITTNTAKTGITTDQATAITTNTAKTGITDAQAAAIVVNTAKAALTTEQATAITANTAKIGITSGQAAAIIVNTAKTGISNEQTGAILVNTAKVTNSTHTGEVTGTDGSDELVIASNVVDEDNLKISNTPSDGDILQYKDDTDQLTWVQDGAGVADDSIAEVKLKISNTPD